MNCVSLREDPRHVNLTNFATEPSLFGKSNFTADDDLIGEVKFLDVKSTLTNGFDITGPELLDNTDSYLTTDSAETLMLLQTRQVLPLIGVAGTIPLPEV